MIEKLKYNINEDVMTIAEQEVEADEKAFKASIGVGEDWILRELRWMPTKMFIEFINIIGEDNLVIFNNEQQGDVIRAKIFISPDGIDKGNEWNKKYKERQNND